MVTWRKSSRSNNGMDCVEVRSDLSAVRDSKNPTGPSLAVDLRALARHLRG
ncbi:DUF397 domain-containing protein [Actinokineospora inagensis]|uniref:DUF397 domain-containing protein n=1 Tax=Actinokineospora inagensis TaxID=103730 RepID=UPI00041D4AE1|nr:DUF397 domain-containing protein [Actinokineospora inagensis]